MHRSFFHYLAPRPEDNELYSQFKYTELKDFDYPPEHHYKVGLSKKQRERISAENQKLKKRRK